MDIFWMSENSPQGLKPARLGALHGTTKVVPFHNFNLRHE